jgi:hypothetical protein
MSKIPSTVFVFMEPCTKPGVYVAVEVSKARSRVRNERLKNEGRVMACQRTTRPAVKGKRCGKDFVYVVVTDGDVHGEPFVTRYEAESYAEASGGKAVPYKIPAFKDETPKVTDTVLVTKSLHAAGRMAVAVNSFLYKPTGKNVEATRRTTEPLSSFTGIGSTSRLTLTPTYPTSSTS